MPRRICPTMEDHEWVTDLRGRCHCQACGLKPEDSDEAHTMEGIDELSDNPSTWNGLVDYSGEGDD